MTKTLPVIAVALFFSYWFSTYSYADSFKDIWLMFSGQSFLNPDVTLLRKAKDLLALIALATMFYPNHDNRPAKWNFVIVVVFVLFGCLFFEYPYVANHSMMMSLLGLGGIYTFVICYLREGREATFANTDYLPLIRAFLIVMYFYGTFHKINPAFLDGNGCWWGFYHNIPLMPDFINTQEIGLYLGGYGTLILESVALILLLFPVTKYWGMLLGLFFHFLIGITLQGTVAHFSAFALAMHMSYLNQNSLEIFKSSYVGRWIFSHRYKAYLLRLPLALFIVVCVFCSCAAYSDFSLARADGAVSVAGANFNIKLMWWIYSIPMMAYVALTGWKVEARPHYYIWAKFRLANIVTILLFLNGVTPYIGLKAHADLAMFSNLRTEWGQSNHFMVPKPLSVFPYLDRDQYVRIISVSDPALYGKVADKPLYQIAKAENINDLDRFEKKTLKITNDKMREMILGNPDVIIVENKYPYITLYIAETMQGAWINIFEIRRVFTETNMKEKSLKYKDHNGITHEINNVDNPDHIMFKPVSAFSRWLLRYIDFVDMKPAPCSSR